MTRITLGLSAVVVILVSCFAIAPPERGVIRETPSVVPHSLQLVSAPAASQRPVGKPRTDLREVTQPRCSTVCRCTCASP